MAEVQERKIHLEAYPPRNNKYITFALRKQFLEKFV